MMSALPGYTLGKILHSGDRTLVYRSIRECDRQTVVIKTLKADFPTVEETARLKQEYQILMDLPLQGVIKPYKLEQYQKRLALVLEDFGSDIKTFVAGKTLALTDWLKIAIQIASILDEIHRHQIIHKDIKPKNLLISPHQEIKIIDFSIASRLSKENPFLSPPSLLEGSLPYLSPEQTGRMNRLIDYRSDLYALGVTFYELLTLRLPFESDDPLELIHAHIAKQPIPPHQVRQDIPVAVSNIIMKLLAKNAEDRYQSAFGVKKDLETALQLTTIGEIKEFAIAQDDTSGHLLIPQKLYGREAEVATLMQAFARIAKVENIELLLISGYSGIGKSSLVNEIYKPILQQRGYFIAGKFDQFQRDIPYASLIQAFRMLMQQLLVESAANLEVWKTKLQQALGENAQVIVEVIPEVELLIGAQPPVPALGATETQARFNRVFQAFIGVFAQKEHPLVLFLDDLQWADSASLKFIQALITDANIGYLLLLGAYRDNEVSASHPLIQTIAQLQETKATVNQIVLKPLSLESVKQLVADTLQQTETSTQLARLLYNKTDGNPFFLTQLLQSLAQTNLIKFDFVTARWTWDLAQIESVGVTDNVVELMVHKIEILPRNTQNLLKLAACIGYRFDLETLAVISQKSVLETAKEIWSAMQAGLILPLSNAYKIPLFVGEETAAIALDERTINYEFLHDRVQQAAEALIPEAERKATHLKIGQRLLQSQSPEQQKENIFELVNQLNYGKDLISDQQQKNQLAKLNLIAGQKQKQRSPTNHLPVILVWD
jgi:serine/threonine protein kinase